MWLKLWRNNSKMLHFDKWESCDSSRFWKERGEYDYNTDYNINQMRGMEEAQGWFSYKVVVDLFKNEDHLEVVFQRLHPYR